MTTVLPTLNVSLNISVTTMPPTPNASLNESVTTTLPTPNESVNMIVTANAERIAEYQRDYRAAHAERIAERNRDYRAAHPEQRRIQKHKRRSLKNNLPFDFTTEDWEGCLDYWEHCCCICGRKAGLWNIIAQEHFIPVTAPRTDNPGTVTWNMLPMCHATKGSMGQSGCNNTKFNKDPEAWLIERFGKRKAARILKRIHAYFEWVKVSH